MNTELTETSNEKNEYVPLGISGFGGWLIVVQIGLFATLLLYFIQIFNTSIPAVFSDIYSSLTATTSTMYHPLWQSIIVFELISNVVLCLFCLFNIVIFYQRRSILPRMMIIFYSSSFLISFIDTMLVYQILSSLEVEGLSLFKGFSRSLLTCAIWIPYFLKSERVENTFIR